MIEEEEHELLHPSDNEVYPRLRKYQYLKLLTHSFEFGRVDLGTLLIEWFCYLLSTAFLCARLEGFILWDWGGVAAPLFVGLSLGFLRSAFWYAYTFVLLPSVLPMPRKLAFLLATHVGDLFHIFLTWCCFAVANVLDVRSVHDLYTEYLESCWLFLLLFASGKTRNGRGTPFSRLFMVRSICTGPALVGFFSRSVQLTSLKKMMYSCPWSIFIGVMLRLGVDDVADFPR
jgi:hypothetical protein